MEDELCPCGSEELYELCCGRFISGEALPEVAEELMRSRYSAYVLKDAAYLLKTWHPSTRPSELSFSDAPQWRGLKIIKAHGLAVEFVARYKVGGTAGKLHEKSRFTREDGKWLYIDGELKAN